MVESVLHLAYKEKEEKKICHEKLLLWAYITVL